MGAPEGAAAGGLRLVVRRARPAMSCVPDYDMCEAGSEDKWIRDCYDFFLGKERQARAVRISDAYYTKVGSVYEQCDVLTHYEQSPKLRYALRLVALLCYVFVLGAFVCFGMALSVAMGGDHTNIEAQILTAAGAVMAVTGVIGIVAVETFSDHLLFVFFQASSFVFFGCLYMVIFVATRQNEVSLEVKNAVAADWERRYWGLPKDMREMVAVDDKLPICETNFSAPCWDVLKDFFVKVTNVHLPARVAQ